MLLTSVSILIDASQVDPESFVIIFPPLSYYLALIVNLALLSDLLCCNTTVTLMSLRASLDSENPPKIINDA